MALYERNTCSFIVKVWVEENDEQHHDHWRGHITHVVSGKRQYFEDLAVVGDFIMSYLTEMGISFDKADHCPKGVH